MNNQSEKPEKLRPQDSERKDITTPENDNEVVRRSEEKNYVEKDADFGNISKSKENSEQPVNPIKRAPKD